jgi:hypothetical protein
VAILALVEVFPPRERLVTIAIAFVVGLVGARSPVIRRWDPKFADRDQTGILDDRALHIGGALPRVLARRDYRVGRPRQFENGIAPHAVIWGATGYHGFQRGPSLRTIDNLALSDALLARAPARDPEHGWGRGHLVRDLPEGYIASVETAENRIVDPSLRAYYDKLLIITTGPLFTLERAKTIWKMNTGAYGYLIDEYDARRKGTK